jgi:hypothetical protein
MTHYKRFSRISVPEPGAASPARGGPAKETPHNKISLEEFERERMGIAAKE